MIDNKEGCVTPTMGPILQEDDTPNMETNVKMEVPMQQARVGKTAPDFELSAFFEGGFKNIRLSDFKGKWIVVCFYPGDFTFV
jgi:hypothetical protein